MAQIDGVKNWLNMALPLKIVINRTNEIAYFVEIDIPCMENADLILTVHITSIYKMCPPPPKWIINAPAQTNHRTEPIFCMDTLLGTTAGYSGAIFEI